MRVAAVVSALVAALVAVVLTMVVMVLSHPEPARIVAAPPVPPSSQTEPPDAGLPDGVDYPLPEVTALPLGRAIVALERVGATVVAYDASVGERSVQPDWDVCTASELYRGDTPTGEVHLAAVPPGDRCP